MHNMLVLDGCVMEKICLSLVAVDRGRYVDP